MADAVGLILAVAIAGFCAAWMTLFPVIGLLWSIGWLK